MNALQNYYTNLLERVDKERQYVNDTTYVNTDVQNQARSALLSERVALNTTRKRDVWNDVKFRKRQREKGYNNDGVMYSGEATHPILSSERFLKQGRHFKERDVYGR